MPPSLPTLLEQQREFARALASQDPAWGLEVYRTHVRERLRAALGERFPVFRRALGADRFRELGDEFIRCHASRDAALVDFGTEFPRFVRDEDPHGLAAIDGAMHAVSRAPAPFPISDLSALGQTRVRLAPWARWLRADFGRWREQAGLAPPGLPSRSVIVYREGDRPVVSPLDEAETAFFLAASEGATIAGCLAATPREAAGPALAFALQACLLSVSPTTPVQALDT